MENFIKWRQANGVSQATFANMLGITNSTLSKYETRKLRLKPEMAKNIEVMTKGQVKALELLGLKQPKGVRDTSAIFEPEASVEARALGLNPEAIAAKAIEDAVKRKRFETWKSENADAIESWNDLVKREGLWSDGLRAF
jgi:antitoxin CcdA